MSDFQKLLRDGSDMRQPLIDENFATLENGGNFKPGFTFGRSTHSSYNR